MSGQDTVERTITVNNNFNSPLELTQEQFVKRWMDGLSDIYRLGAMAHEEAAVEEMMRKVKDMAYKAFDNECNFS